MTHVITQSCCNDASCIPVCPANCIRPAPGDLDFGTTSLLHIDPDLCIDCGACVPECPVGAIVPDSELTEEEVVFLELNSSYFDQADLGPLLKQRPKAREAVDDVLKVAIIGSGPAAHYATQALAELQGIRTSINMLEKLPIPGGLATYGVAPDHERTRRIRTRFDSIRNNADVNLYTNVDVGPNLPPTHLLQHHHAVIYATGAAQSRKLELPGFHLKGVHTAEQVVGWYNGHPDALRAPEIAAADTVLIIGNGNVALDIARIILLENNRLEDLELDDEVRRTLMEAEVKEVILVSRSGPADAACSVSELIGLNDLDDVTFVLEGESNASHSKDAENLDEIERQRKVEALHRLTSRSPARVSAKRMTFRFFSTPTGVEGRDYATGLRVLETLNMPGKEVPKEHVIEGDVVIQCLGYQAQAQYGIPFDRTRSVIPNSSGRILSDAGEPLPGMYTTGWARRGATGVMGTNRQCAKETVEALLDDWLLGKLPIPIEPDESFTKLMEAHNCH